MSKARVNPSVSVNITGKQQQQTKSSIVSINVLNKMASSIESTSTSKSTSKSTSTTFDASTSKLKSCSQQTAAITKKRMALGNISNQNGTGSSTGDNAASSSNSSTTKEVTKKGRFGNNLTNFVSSVNKTNKQPTNEAQTTLAKKGKAVSKENLASIGRKKDQTVNKKSVHLTTTDAKLTKGGVSKSENDIKKQVDLENRLANASLTASEEKLHGTCNIGAPVGAIKSKADLVEGWDNIDAADEGDEFTCSDYVEAIFKYYRRREDTFGVGDYLSKQKNITKHMRLLLVDWMVEVQQQLEFNHEVLYLSVKLVDLFLNSFVIEREKLQLLAGAAMFIACKFEERMPPIIDDFIYVSDNAYSRAELIKMEIDLLKTVSFDLGAPLSYTFLRRYSKCIRADMKFLTLSRYILELSLQDYTFAYERDSLKACASLYLAMKMAVAYENNVKMNESLDNPAQLTVTTTNLTSTEWNPTLIHYTGAFVADFIHLIPAMNNLIKMAPACKQKTIFKKYSHQVFYEVAKIPSLNDSQIESLMTAVNVN